MANDNDTLTLLQRVQSICLAEGCPEPIEWLAEVMAGKDPRFDASPLFHLVSVIVDRYGDEMPSLDDWHSVKNLVLMDPGYRPSRVEHAVSMRAAEKLIEHLHPKLKAIDVSGIDTATGATELQEHEIELLKKKLDDEY